MSNFEPDLIYGPSPADPRWREVDMEARSRLFELARRNVVVSHVMDTFLAGSMGWETALIKTIELLAMRHDEMQDHAIAIMERNTQPIVMQIPSSEGEHFKLTLDSINAYVHDAFKVPDDLLSDSTPRPQRDRDES